MHRTKHAGAPDRIDDQPVAWAVTAGLVPFLDAEAFMEARVKRIAEDGADELIWLVEHPPLFTSGTSAKPEDLLWPDRFPVYNTGRGGQFTYHGPGQRVVYVMLDVKRRTGDVRAFVGLLEAWMISALARLGVAGETRVDRVGVWVRRPPSHDGGEVAGEDKIGAIGIRVRRWISYHGLSLNVAPDLSHFDGIVPCGVREHGVTSLAGIGCPADMDAVDQALREAFQELVGPTKRAPPPALSPVEVDPV